MRWRRQRPTQPSPSSLASGERRVLLTQDLDFSALVALSRQSSPSVISLRLGSSRTEHVNARLAAVLPTLERDVEIGVIVAVEDHRIRRRSLPI